jgi:hypothetical protein
MELTQELTDLICELEYLIGDQCYNPNSYDGYTGDEGRSFRYPVYTYTDKSTDELVKIRGHVNGSARSIYGSVTPDLVRSMRYKFGSNHLYIGEAIYSVLVTLEKRYGICFEELEAEHLRKGNE